MGNLVLEIDRVTMKHVATTVEFNNRVSKKSKATVATDLCLQKESASVSAVLYGASDCVNYPFSPGADFILVHNPNATTSVPDDWLPIGASQYHLDGDKLRRDAATK